MLEIKNLYAYYGAIEALRGVDLAVKEGEIVSLIGANGAGKSTLLTTICGLMSLTSGSITYEGESLLGQPTYQIVRRGIAQAPEGRRVFPRMTVMENLLLGGISVSDQSGQTLLLEKILHLFPRLKERSTQRAGTLSGGEQQMLAIGRALMSRPRLLLLDEPSMGLAPMIVKQIFSVIVNINREENVTILLVEQNAHHALRIANRAYVLVNGTVSLTGTGAELLSHPEVQAAYLEGGHA